MRGLRRTRRWVAVCALFFYLFRPGVVRADFWGGDVIVLGQILQNAIQQLLQLKQLLGTGQDTLGLIRDINRGLRDALSLMRTQNTTLSPGVLSQLQNADDVLRAVEQLYGTIPRTAEAPVQRTTDQSVAEAIHLHNEAFRYAERVDPEAERIKDYARVVNPLGAERLTAQSMGVLIHVLNQVLRTNAAILKVQSEQLALANRREKLNSEQYRMQYEGLGRAFGELRPAYELPSLAGGSK